MDNDSGWGGLLSLLAFSGMYLLGNHNGRNQLTNELADKYRDNEIARLAKELADIKRINGIIS
jgi:hypothetical protein